MKIGFGEWNKDVAVVLGLGVGAATVLAVTNQAQALPSFARQYKVECATCHTQYPERNAFGEAFERNGFIWPSKKKPALTEKGSEGLMLSGIPEGVPISIYAHVDSTYNSESLSDGGSAPKFNYSQPSGVEMFGAGNFREKVGYMAQVVFEDNEAAVEALWLQFKDPFDIPMDVKIGQFRPTLSPLSLGYGMGIQNYSYNNSTILSTDAFKPRDKRAGIELATTLAGKVYLAGGLVNGNGIDNAGTNNVSPYAHLSWRVIGTDLHGNQPEVDLNAAESFSDYLTLTLSGWGITGSQHDTEEDYSRYGADAEALYKAWRLRLSSSWGTDDEPLLSAATAATGGDWYVDPADGVIKQHPVKAAKAAVFGDDIDLRTYHATVEYMINSQWMVGGTYSHLDIDEWAKTEGQYPQNLYGLNVSYLFYQNLKLAAAYIHDTWAPVKADLSDGNRDVVKMNAYFAF